MTHPSVKEMWNRFINLHPDYSKIEFTSWHFCNSQKCADELAVLVKAGIKTATCSLNYWYENGNEKHPEAGEFNVITNWDGTAQCITKTVKVTEMIFRDMTEELAAREGEGDRTLEHWRRVHIRYFTDELKKENIEFNEDMKILFEEFEKVFE